MNESTPRASNLRGFPKTFEAFRKMKQLFIKGGQAVLDEVPEPDLEAGTVLVRVSHSCISSGTEMAGVRNSGQPLWRRALSHPDEVRKVVKMATSQGVLRTRSVVEGRLAEGLAVGYSAAGVVVAAGALVDQFRPGDRVACAGSGYACHAEVIRVPRNLVCAIPSALSSALASTVALGAIAMQGVRRAQPTLGETFVVVGLGALGQITTQLLRANGCRVIGTDLSRERVAFAMERGMDAGFTPGDGDDFARVHRLTRDVGADGVIITASSPADALVSTAFRMCRRRGRVILVGDVGLGLKRQDIFEKELDFLVSTSYGPGRYDRSYEEGGQSYPVAYVRWTETRNMQEYLELAATGRIAVGDLVGREFPLAAAPSAYAALAEPSGAPILTVLTYDQPEATAASPSVRIKAPPAIRSRSSRVRLAVVGPGGFVKAVHLPNLASMSDAFHLRAIVSRSGGRALAAARQFGADEATSDFGAVVADASIDAVMIATRHDQHAQMTLQALRGGKHVFVEKPLALTSSELDEIGAFFEASPAAAKPILLTGFNRRFSPYLRRIREQVARRTSPLMMTYRMNAGYIEPGHWVHGIEGGGRNLGEACHIYDVFTYLTDARVTSVSVQSIPPPSGHRDRTDNFIATLRFDEGSIASLVYTSLGHTEFPKERLEVFVDGAVLAVDDYRELTAVGLRLKPMKARTQDKGHLAELRAFADGIRAGEWPIPLWQQLQASEVALRVQDGFRGQAD